MKKSACWGKGNLLLAQPQEQNALLHEGVKRIELSKIKNDAVVYLCYKLNKRFICKPF